MALITLEILNGSHYLGLQEGELLVRKGANCIVFPHDCPVAQRPLEYVNMDADLASNFIAHNVYQLMRTVDHDGAGLSLRDASIVAYHRLLAVKHGLVSPKFVPADFHVDYTECALLDKEAEIPKDVFEPKAIRDVLTDAVQKSIAETFTDRVCLVAFIFRSRGHHYMDSYEQLYGKIWQKCRYGDDKLYISFQNLATLALHAVYPSILEDFWTEGVRNMHVNGALAKRYDGAPAGAAGPYILQQGIQDLQMIAPGLRDVLKEGYEYLEGVIEDLRIHRYAGSVNARYYGTKKVHFDEKRVSAIAATIVAALEGLASDAPMLGSPALNRIANNAPLTGAVFAKAVLKVGDRPEIVNALLIEHA